MIGITAEFRRDLELPVVALNPDSTPVDVAKLVGEVMDFKLPGFAITSLNNGDLTANHQLHLGLVLEACYLAVPKAESKVTDTDDTEVDVDGSSGLHVDNFGLRQCSQMSACEMELFVHTAISSNGAKVVMANAGVNLDITKIPAAQSKLFIPAPPMDSEGHENNGGLFSIEDELGRIEQIGGTNPLYCEPQMYHFTQYPGHSVVMRTNTSLGPPAAHSFRSIEHKTRKYRRSIISVVA